MIIASHHKNRIRKKDDGDSSAGVDSSIAFDIIKDLNIYSDDSRQVTGVHIKIKPPPEPPKVPLIFVPSPFIHNYVQNQIINAQNALQVNPNMPNQNRLYLLHFMNEMNRLLR